jgi:hypothetical protein
MSLRRAVALVACTLLAGALCAGCGGDDDGVATSARDTATTTTNGGTPATSGGSTATTPSGTVAPTAPGTDLRVVFLDGAKLATGHRRVAPTQAVARAALEQLIAGPNGTETGTGFHSVVRPQTTVGGLDIASGVATVTLSPALDSGVDAATAHQAMGQVVFTLTQFPTVESVRFGGGTPMTRADFTDITPLIFVESVAPGDAVASPVKVSGMSNTFEANVRIRVVGERAVRQGGQHHGDGGGVRDLPEGRIDGQRGGDPGHVLVSGARARARRGGRRASRSRTRPWPEHSTESAFST